VRAGPVEVDGPRAAGVEERGPGAGDLRVALRLGVTGDGDEEIGVARGWRALSAGAAAAGRAAAGAAATRRAGRPAAAAPPAGPCRAGGAAAPTAGPGGAAAACPARRPASP